MGWLWGKSDPPKSSDSDPLRDLDPSLRDFLSKESPVKYTPAPPPPAPPPETTTPAPSREAEPSSTPVVPAESLYPDGRYAHLWTSYKSLSAIEAESKSDQEKLLDILEGYKERKAQIGRAAVENCVEEQLAVNDCYDTGRWRDKLMMCRGENRAFERCYIMQSVCPPPLPKRTVQKKKKTGLGDRTLTSIRPALPQSPRLPLHLLAARVRRRSHPDARRHPLPPHAGAGNRRRRRRRRRPARTPIRPHPRLRVAIHNACRGTNDSGSITSTSSGGEERRLTASDAGNASAADGGDAGCAEAAVEGYDADGEGVGGEGVGDGREGGEGDGEAGVGYYWAEEE